MSAVPAKTAAEDLEKLRAARNVMAAISAEARKVPAPGDNVSAQWWTEIRLRIESLEKLANDAGLRIARLEDRMQTASGYVQELVTELRSRKVIGPAKKKGPTNGKK